MFNLSSCSYRYVETGKSHSSPITWYYQLPRSVVPWRREGARDGERCQSSLKLLLLLDAVKGTWPEEWGKTNLTHTSGARSGDGKCHSCGRDDKVSSLLSLVARSQWAPQPWQTQKTERNNNGVGVSTNTCPHTGTCRNRTNLVKRKPNVQTHMCVSLNTAAYAQRERKAAFTQS